MRQKFASLTRRRLLAYLGRGRINARLYPEKLTPSLQVFSTADRVPYSAAIRGRFRPAHPGEHFGPLWSTHWFRLECRIPKAWAGSEVHLLWDSSSEACVWKDGKPLQGLTGTRLPGPGSVPIRKEFPVCRRARGGEQLRYVIEAACNQLVVTEGKEEFIGILRQAEVARFDRRAWDLLWDLTVIAEMALELPPDVPRAAQALFTANAMLDVLEAENPASWRAARALAAKFFSARNGDGQHRISAAGHAHLDTAWFWPLAETHRKCVRTFSTALKLMEEYPEYRFAASAAQHYDWMRREQPALFARMRRRVRQGRLVPVGGMWVEPDGNMPSGESTVRQLLYGQRFFQQAFGLRCEVGWLPDVFGYNGQLPQLMRGAGIRYFVTQKLRFNQFTQPMHHTFWWEGIDGTRVLTHLPPADTYGGTCAVRQLLHNVRNYRDLDRSNESLYLFGHSDGGGGPTREMLERLRRARDVDGLPRVAPRAPGEALTRIERDATDLAVHVGEMYLEEHRGTYTSQALVKRNNRRSEDLLHDVELLCSIAPGPYPAAVIESLWKTVLLNQFHDILPGSSIAMVHRESAEQFARMQAQGADLCERAIDALGFRPGARVLAVNTLSMPRREVVDVPGGSADPVVVEAPSMGFAVQEPVTQTDAPVRLREGRGRITIENAQVRAVFRKDGCLVSLWDKRAGREALAGAANKFVLYRNEAIEYDAWNIEAYHLEMREETPGAERMRILERHPLRAAIEFSGALTDRSRYRQVVRMDALSPRVEFMCDVDWQERDRVLKVEFPTALRTDRAAYEIAFGHVHRATHSNTPHDLARFEVPAHRWADLSEPGFGLALLNDCKYGHSAEGGVLRLSLLTSAKKPDPEQDMGAQQFRYALVPHPGSLQEAGIVHEARRFNVPLRLRRVDAEPAGMSWFSVEPAGVVIDTVKRAEDDGVLIVRLVESHGTRSRVRLRSTLPIRSAARCNLLEEEERAAAWRNGGMRLTVRPFEVVTIKLRPGKRLKA